MEVHTYLPRGMNLSKDLSGKLEMAMETDVDCLKDAINKNKNIMVADDTYIDADKETSQE